MKEDIDMKRQYIAPETEVMKIATVGMLAASNETLNVSNDVVTDGNVFADGKETEVSSGSVWGEEE